MKPQPLKTQKGITILAQYIKDCSFENPNAIQTLSNPPSKDPEIAVNLQVQAKQAGEKVFEVEILVNITGKNENQSLFVLEITYAGLFGIDEDNEHTLRKLILIECPALIFPSVRHLSRVIAQESGFLPNFNLAPVDFEALYASHQEEPLEGVH